MPIGITLDTNVRKKIQGWAFGINPETMGAEAGTTIYGRSGGGHW